MEARFELSTRPDNKLGTDEEWDFTEGALRAALERRGIEYQVNAGDGAFYGPKIDLHMKDTLGRSWQMGTIQLDAQMPQRFELSYVGADNQEHFPYVIHRALLGSLERFMGILTEHYGGAFPFWLAPGADPDPPGRRGPPGSRGRSWPRNSSRTGSRSTPPTTRSASGSATARSRRSRSWSIYGDKESDESLAIREHGGGQSTRSLAEFRTFLANLEPWQAGAKPSLTS